MAAWVLQLGAEDVKKLVLQLAGWLRRDWRCAPALNPHMCALALSYIRPPRALAGGVCVDVHCIIRCIRRANKWNFLSIASLSVSNIIKMLRWAVLNWGHHSQLCSLQLRTVQIMRQHPSNWDLIIKNFHKNWWHKFCLHQICKYFNPTLRLCRS